MSVIERVSASRMPTVEFIKRAEPSGRRVGVFASSFNPITIAHMELMRRAASEFALDEMLALAGCANADKTRYECSLEDRLRMLALALECDERASIGLSSHPYFADIVEALDKEYASRTDLRFIMGFDTFERALDLDGRYFPHYYRRFSDRAQALERLVSRSSLIVAARAGSAHSDFLKLVERESRQVAERVFYLDFPADLGERSASEVRARVRCGDSIEGLVPQAVERYIRERKLYR